jgi:hypothetical protein
MLLIAQHLVENFMLSRIMLLGVTTVLGISSALAAPGCDPALLEQYRECARVVDTLRPEKSGQARVFASDGSEFTAGQALWMQGQLRKFERLCAQASPANQEEASAVLAAVQQLLKEHQRA